MKICSKHGKYPKFRESGFSGKLWEQECPHCNDEKIKQQEEEEREEERSRLICEFHRKSNIPKRFKGMTFDDIDFTHQKDNSENQKMIKIVNYLKNFITNLPDRLQLGSSGFLCGECGTGKTMLACIIVESAINQCFSAQYTTAWQMVQRIRQGYSAQESTSHFIREFVSKSLLVIDEIGVQNGTNDERVLLYQVIDGRYNEVKPTILISNSKNPVEDGFLDLRTIDRLKEGKGFSVSFNGDSYRK